MDISSTSATNSTAIGTVVVQGANTKAGKSNLNSEDFMKLLTTQMSNQDPMNPVADTEFISQMANFSSLEQMRTLSNSFTTFASEQKMSAAPSFLGKQVTVKSGSGDVSGTVESIALKDGEPAVVIDGKSYEIRLITAINQAGLPNGTGSTMPPPPPPPPPPPTSTDSASTSSTSTSSTTTASTTSSTDSTSSTTTL